MKKLLSGLSPKLIASVLLFSILLCSCICYMGYHEFTTVLEDQYNRSAYEIAETVKTYLDSDRINHYLETEETDDAYWEIIERLDELVVSTDSVVIYVIALSDSYTTSHYVFNAPHPSMGWSRYPLGYTAKDLDPNYTAEVEKMIVSGEQSSVYLYSYSEASGAHTTAAIPVKDSSGQVVALACVEKAMTALDSARSTYVINVLLLTLVVVTIFLGIYIVFLRRQVVSPILSITQEAQRFAEDNVAHESLPQVDKTDELGILARAIVKMESDIVTYVKNLTAVTAEKERIGAELNVATQIQADMLPRIFPAFPDRKEFDIHATMTPAKEVGGDFYDFFLVDEDHLAVVMADVSGKGVPAALFMVIAKTLIKNHAQAGLEPAQVFMNANNQLCEGNEAGMFVTAFLGVLEISTGKFTYVNAGHNPPLIRQDGRPYDWLPTRRGFVLAGMEDMIYRQQEIFLKPGDSIFLYTDGVTEALNPAQELYSEQRLKELFNTTLSQDSPLEQQLSQVRDSVSAFADGAEQADDITILMLKINTPER